MDCGDTAEYVIVGKNGSGRLVYSDAKMGCIIELEGRQNAMERDTKW